MYIELLEVGTCVAHRILIRQGLSMLKCIMLAAHVEGVLLHGFASAILLRHCVADLKVNPHLNYIHGTGE